MGTTLVTIENLSRKAVKVAYLIVEGILTVVH